MLKRVSIQNFKSLKDVTLDLQKVNLLIGPNNSGKTNFLKALEFIGPNRRGKYDINQVTFDKDLHNKIRIKLLWPSDREGYTNKGIEFYLDAGEVNNQKGYFGNKQAEEVRGHKTQFQDFFPDFNIELPTSILELERTKIYKPDPNKLTQPGPVGTGAETVNADASNLVGFLDLMLGKYRRPVFNRTEKDLQTCIPEFDEINLEDAPPTDELKKQFGDKSFKKIGLTNSKQGITYWADELSEGTLYFLALLCIINQPNPPKLLLLEEPEKGIHPRRIWQVMKFIFQLAEEKDIQIILTTHNEHVINAFSSIPESVFVFDKDEEGGTYVQNLQKDIIEPTDKKSEELGLDKIDLTSNLGENWLYGLIGGVPADEL